MTEEEIRRREVASRFLQAVRNKVFGVVHAWYPPEVAASIVDQTERKVEVEGQLVEDVEVVDRWFQSDADVAWLEAFWQSPEGSRFLELNAELTMRSIMREFAPPELRKLLVPPPRKNS